MGQTEGETKCLWSVSGMETKLLNTFEKRDYQKVRFPF